MKLSAICITYGRVLGRLARLLVDILGLVRRRPGLQMADIIGPEPGARSRALRPSRAFKGDPEPRSPGAPDQKILPLNASQMIERGSEIKSRGAAQ